MIKSPSELEELLWKSAETDAPPSDGAERLSAALATRLEGVSSCASRATPTPSLPGAVAASSPSAAWKGGLLVSALLVASFVLVQSTMTERSTSTEHSTPTEHSRPTEAPPREPPANEHVAPLVAPPPAAEPVPSSASVLSVDDLPAAPSTAIASHRLVPATAPSAPPPSSLDPTAAGRTVAAPAPSTRASDLDAEVALLDEVREHLRSGAPARATALLGQYDGRFPQGLLRREAKVLQIEARAASGDKAIAHELAVSFLAQHPNDPHAARVRQLEAQVRP